MSTCRAFTVAKLLLLVTACSTETTTSEPLPNPVPVHAVQVTPTTASVAVGATVALRAIARSAAGDSMAGQATWTATPTTVASVNGAGVVTGIAAGQALITATIAGKSNQVAVTVTAAPPVEVTPVASIEIVTALDTLEAHEVRGLQAITRDAEGKVLAGRGITWSVSNPQIATVANAPAAITGVDRGTVTITATSEGQVATATRVVVIRYRSITAGTMHACDIASGGIAWCWGLNGTDARLGDAVIGDGVFRSSPFQVPGGHRFTRLVTYGRTTCGLDHLGKAWCWGTNSWGNVGSGSNLPYISTPAAVAGNRTFVELSAGSNHVCGIEAVTTTAYCWGNNEWRHLGDLTSTARSAPVAVQAPVGFLKIAAGTNATCGVTTTNAAWCWGANSIGQMGDGGPISYGNVFVTAPQPVVGGLQFSSLTLGDQFTCGITLAQAAYCWGSHNTKLGSAGGDTSSPRAVAGGLLFTALSAGYGHACGVTTQHEIWCWGSNGYGQLGNPLQGGSTTPVRAGGDILGSEVVAAGINTGSGGHSCGISRDRLTTWCWGRNDVGQLGNGQTTAPATRNTTPVIVVGQKPL
jgi:alpha-tubulin suppressor-like RCC1 family protein